jgi:CheY-like chemotaxis protein
MITDLILNAVEAVPKGGILKVRTQCLGKWVGLEVIDSGVGMTAEVEKRCLEPFFSTKGSGHAGMGMTIANGIVGQHHGTIDLETRAGKGTIVAVCLPVEFQQASAISSDADGIRALHGLNVLVVDDEAWTRAALVHNLMSEGCRVEIASDGKSGLEKFRKGKFDLVLTDRAMPDMSGDDLAEAIKAIDPRKPVVLVSGFGDAADEGGKVYGHVDGVLSKPVRISDFRRMIAKVMDLSREA